MVPAPTAIGKDLVLVGGGHSHVTVMKRFGMDPVPGLRLTLVTRDVHTPYSGMLPGFIAGRYEYDDCHIDLRRLARFCGCRFIHAAASQLDLANRQVRCADRPPIPFDLLSINTGSRPEVMSVPGAGEYTLPAKPVDRFIVGWETIQARVLEARGRFRIVVVGAGAGGVELALATQYRLRAQLSSAGFTDDGLEYRLLTDATDLLPTHNQAVRKRFRDVLESRGIGFHTHQRVVGVERDRVHCEGGQSFAADAVLWTTRAAAPTWIGESGLATDAEGFLQVDTCLQSVSHPGVFAAGDIAAVVAHPRPKSGVFAVRQGLPLATNLRRAVLEQPLKPFTPQKRFLSLIGTGDTYAVASRGALFAAGHWVWRWKEWIDRRFMAKFNDLPAMAEDKASGKDGAKGEISTIAMRCGGCGAKVGSTVLARVINRLAPVVRDDVLIGLQAPDDAAAVAVPPGQVLVQSVDYFRAFVDDAYLFGRIAANHALGDIFAMGAEAQSALALATVPYASEAVVEDQLYQMMAGAVEVLNSAGIALVGGHSSEGAELAFGLSVTGLADPQTLLRKGGLQAGDALVLTKPLGTGTLFAADMRGQARGRWITGALETMLQSNQAGAECLREFRASACTDVTGFGVLGHLVEMLRPAGLDAEIDLDALPLLDGACEAIEAGIFSSLQPENLRLRRAVRDVDRWGQHRAYPLLFDPQTAGGLLAGVPEASAAQCIDALRARGYDRAAVIGRVQAPDGDESPVKLRDAGTGGSP